MPRTGGPVEARREACERGPVVQPQGDQATARRDADHAEAVPAGGDEAGAGRAVAAPSIGYRGAAAGEAPPGLEVAHEVVVVEVDPVVVNHHPDVRRAPGELPGPAHSDVRPGLAAPLAVVVQVPPELGVPVEEPVPRQGVGLGELDARLAGQGLTERQDGLGPGIARQEGPGDPAPGAGGAAAARGEPGHLVARRGRAEANADGGGQQELVAPAILEDRAQLPHARRQGSPGLPVALVEHRRELVAPFA